MNYSQSVETLLESFCVQKIADAEAISPRYSQLWREIKTYLLTGGKRMRPRLVMMAYEAYGGKNPEAITSVAAAWELLHACVLVHDDIIDRDTIRHGQPNIAGRYQSTYGSLGGIDSDHYALSAALISGDLLLMSAYELAAAAEISNEEKLLAQSYLSKATFVVAGGELIDTDSVLYGFNETDPIVVATHKTASYSLQLPLQCGAALAGVGEQELAKLAEMGLHTGIAYQLKDDLLGVFGDSEVTGKSIRSDIVEKKRTYLMNEALHNLPPQEASTLSRFLAPSYSISAQDAEEIVQLIATSGAKERTEQTIQNESKIALSVVEKLSIDTMHKEKFTSLISTLTERSH